MMSVSTSISTSGLWAASGVETPLELLLPSGCTIAAFLARPARGLWVLVLRRMRVWRAKLPGAAYGT